jgi:phosphoribosylformylglycinamidine synthase
MKARVHVTLKNGVLDPQGKAIGHSLNRLGFAEVGDVRQGKYIELEIAETDKGKAKAAGAETSTTAAPAPPGPPPVEPVFDPTTLTPGPLPSPGGDITALIGPDDGTNLDTSAAASLLNPDKAGDDTGLLLMALGALVLFLLAALVWGWHHRSSRYFPA